MRLLLCLLIACEGQLSSPVKDDRVSLPTRASGPRKDANGRYICNDAHYPGANEARPLTKTQYERAIADIFDGKVAASPQFPARTGAPSTGYTTEPQINVLGEQGVEQALYAAEDVAVAVAAVLPSLLPCTQNRACAEAFVDKYGRRAYRRALSSAERNELLDTFDAGLAVTSDFTQAVAMVTDHMLQTAHFLWVAEATGQRPLTGDELASRLSFMFWDSVPDDALLDAAPSLTTPDALAQQAERLLASDRANTTVARFFREWTATVPLTAAQRDVPGFTDAVATSMGISFDRFAVDAVRNGGSLRSLLRSPELHLDATLATFLGVPAPSTEWQKVTLDPTRYSGIMTQPALMAALAHPSDTSYVLRGRYVRKRLLCDVLGAPPGNAMAEFANLQRPVDPTGKDISASVNGRTQCTGCHSLMDPAGLAFEHFDAGGRWRDKYPLGKSIDPSGTLSAVRGESIAFTDHIALLEALSQEPGVSACFAQNVFRFAFSRVEDETDACTLQAMNDAIIASDGNVHAAFLTLVRSDAFAFRRDR